MGLLKWRFWIILIAWQCHVRLSEQKSLKICLGKKAYEYDMNSCPGGIQLRNVNRWLSKARKKACICGSGSVLQFDGQDSTLTPDVYPSDFPLKYRPFQGSFYAYNLKDCERLLGDQAGALLLNLNYFEDPENFPHRPIEVLVSPTEHNRLVGSYRLGIFGGLFRKQDVQIQDALKTVIFNSKDPVIIAPDPQGAKNKRLCAHTVKPDIVLAKYYTSTWFQPGEITSPNCGSKSFPFYQRPRASCNSACSKAGTPEDETREDKGAKQFQKIFETMAEVSLRLKYTKKEITFTDSEPHISLLQKSCRVFFRAFPNVIKWETLLNAVVIFSISFEGLIPAKIEKEALAHIKVALGRCALEQSRHREANDALLKKICSGSSSKKGNGTSSGTDTFKEYNNLIELLWQIVQFTQAKCLPSSDHYPNVHHFYSTAMIELFSSPVVQLLWHQSPEYQDAMNRAMLHVLPELPDHALETIHEILKHMDYHVYYSILHRPKIKKLEERDMRCAGHGKIIWGGKACCYHEEDDKTYHFYNRVTFAKL